MLEGVDPKSVTIGQSDPVLVDVNQPDQRGVDIGGHITEPIEVTPLVFRVWVVQGTPATESRPSAPQGRILRSVLMKPETEEHVPRLHDQVLDLLAEFQPRPTAQNRGRAESC